MFGPGGWTFVLGVRLDAAPWLEREHVHGEIVASVDAAGEGEHLTVQGSLDDRAQVILERVLEEQSRLPEPGVLSIAARLRSITVMLS